MNRLHVIPFVVALQIACSSEPGGRRGEVGVFDAGNAGASGSAGVGNPGGSGGQAGTVGNADNALTVDVEDVAGMTIEIVTLSCAGDCADIEAVARGGHAPYAFTWEDGSMNPQRRVCLDASTELTVSVTDTAFDTEEFDYRAQTASTDVTATVLDCSDGGVPDASVPGGDACFENPSFEGTAEVNITGGEFSAPLWTACTGPGRVQITASVWSEDTAVAEQALPSPAATDGATYMRLMSCIAPGCFQPFIGEGTDLVWQELCSTMRAGQTYSFEIDIASPDALSASWGNTRGELAIWGSSESSCSLDELLWTSPGLTPELRTHCVSVTPARDTRHLSFAIASAPGLKLVYFDHIVPVTSCPE
jgi:hypothetical protein